MAATPNWALWGVSHWPRQDNNSKCNHAWNWNERVQISIHSQQIQIHSRDKSKRSPVTAPTAGDFTPPLLEWEGGTWEANQEREDAGESTRNHKKRVSDEMLKVWEETSSLMGQGWRYGNGKDIYLMQERNMEIHPIWKKEKWGLWNIIGWKANVSETMGSTPVTGHSGAQHGSSGKIGKGREGRVGAHSWVGDRMRAALLARVTWLHPPPCLWHLHPEPIMWVPYFMDNIQDIIKLHMTFSHI